ncbi:slipin family protein [Planctomycetes bacterium K23_9]|uniref:FtsH protease regulator HflK n=1 Tax=Stieleria marina TaxID=1930275 RepID=A0A517NN61_9BACT|nr:FtsH protease regulator HflK [Planctomycetes bacterium K23_9]
MFGIQNLLVRDFETAIVLRRGVQTKRLDAGRRVVLGRAEVIVFDRREVSLLDARLSEIVRSGLIDAQATVVDLSDNQRALVWIDNRFFMALSPGLFAFWNDPHAVRIEIVEIDDEGLQLQHPQLPAIVENSVAARLLDVCRVGAGRVGVKLVDGRFIETVGPGLYAFWRSGRKAQVIELDTRETQLDIGGQELMTADRVTLRLNVNVVYRVVDPARTVEATSDVQQALYREVQLALRTAVGQRDLDALLNDRDSLSVELAKSVEEAAVRIGVELVSVGVRDIILPGDMKELMNQVVQARKAAEANLITRREETAAIRSQANTAKLLADNPALMRLRELETLERVAQSGTLKVNVGDGRLTDKLTNLI